jgi:NAD(P)-dependent dehydrogenase (short-subunit alcohol dehydrogenase family)
MAPTQTSRATRTVVITGGNAGIGYACAATLAADPSWHVVLACRNQERGADAARAIAAATGNTSVEAMRLDLAKLASVRAFAAALAGAALTGGAPAAGAARPPLRALVCNAGVQLVRGVQYTADGVEATFGVNHLGHFLLALQLLDALTPPARVVFVSSGTHDPRRRTGLPAPRYDTAEALAYPERGPSAAAAGGASAGRRRYTTAKLCNVLCAYEMDRRLRAADPARAVAVNVFDPGAVPGTGLARDAGRLTRLVWDGGVSRLVPLLARAGLPFRTPDAAGRALARLVTDPALEGVSGRYFEGEHEARSSAESYDRRKAADLWATSVRLAGVERPLTG